MVTYTVYITLSSLKKYLSILLNNEIIYLKFKSDNILSVPMRALILLSISFSVLILIHIIRKRNFWLIYFIPVQNIKK
ncbi:TPA: hypothetical protein ACR0U2_002943, partial [Enterococcus faecium]